MKNLSALIVLHILFTACNKKLESTSEPIKEIETLVEFRNMPDSVILKKKYYAGLYYDSVLDSIKLKEKDKRFTLLYVTTEEGNFIDVEQIQKVHHRIFLYNDSLKTFDFEFDIKNNKQHTFKAVIEDMVILDDYFGDGKARIITNLHQIEFDCEVYQPQKDIL